MSKEERQSLVCHLTSVHRSGDARIFHKECKSLAKVYPPVTLVVASDESPNLKDGVSIVPVAKARGRLGRMFGATWRVYRAGVGTGAKLFHFHDPELIPVGLLLKLNGKRVIYDVHEDVGAQILDKHWIPKPLRGIVSRLYLLLEKAAVRCFDAVVAAEPPVSKKYPPEKTVVVQNYPKLDELYIDNGPHFGDRPMQAAYVGGISILRGADTMVKAMAMLPEALNARLVLCGLIDPENLQTELEKMEGWERVDFRGWAGRDTVREVYSQSRAGLVVLRPIPNYIESYPVKMFEYMCAGLPVVASDFPLWRSIIEDAGCGIIVDPFDPESTASAVRWLLENPEEAEAMGKRGQAAALKRYNWAIEEKKLRALYAKLTSVNRNSPDETLF